MRTLSFRKGPKYLVLLHDFVIFFLKMLDCKIKFVFFKKRAFQLLPQYLCQRETCQKRGTKQTTQQATVRIHLACLLGAPVLALQGADRALQPFILQHQVLQFAQQLLGRENSGGNIWLLLLSLLLLLPLRLRKWVGDGDDDDDDDAGGDDDDGYFSLYSGYSGPVTNAGVMMTTTTTTTTIMMIMMMLNGEWWWW